MKKPECQLNYIGSKYKLLDFIYGAVKDYCPDLENMTFCDLFSGTGIVARFFKPLVKSIYANDMEYYSYVVLKNYIGSSNFSEELNLSLLELNALDGIEGFIFKNYCGGSGLHEYAPGKITNRLYFSDENGKKIDAIRIKLENKRLFLSEKEYYFCLCSLLEAADKVANTASVYGAFLKKIKKSAQKPLLLTPSPFENGDGVVFNEDANLLVTKIQGDILYLDPPYNQREYGANYHILNTIAKYDNFIPQGKTGLRPYIKSKYCSKKNVLNALDCAIKTARFKYIFLSYNNEGLMSLRDVMTIMQKYGKYELRRHKYQRFKADNNRIQSRKSTHELLHCLIK